jgi:hypothetical protein
LQQAKGNPTKIRAAIRQYINQGNKLIHSPMILWDYFAISSPGIPEQAGFSTEETEEAIAIFGDLSDAKFGES